MCSSGAAGGAVREARDVGDGALQLEEQVRWGRRLEKLLAGSCASLAMHSAASSTGRLFMLLRAEGRRPVVTASTGELHCCRNAYLRPDHLAYRRDVLQETTAYLCGRRGRSHNGREDGRDLPGGDRHVARQACCGSCPCWHGDGAIGCLALE